MAMTEGNMKTKSKAYGNGLRRILDCTYSPASSPSFKQEALYRRTEDHVGLGLGLGFGFDGDVDIEKGLFSTATGEHVMSRGKESRDLRKEGEGEGEQEREEERERAESRSRRSSHLSHRSYNWQGLQSISAYIPPLLGILLSMKKLKLAL